jgi:uncharacterized protein (DUF952 family)
MTTEPIYHICRRGDWDATRGLDPLPPADFIHFSSAAQVAESAARHWAGQPGLVLLTVDPLALGDGLRWEPSRGDKLFPHLYASLTGAAVIGVDDLPLGADGRHVFPPGVVPGGAA